MSYTIVDPCVLDLTTHSTGHVYIITKNRNVILGHDKKYDHIGSFGGFGDPDETLLQTILREWDEESHGSIMDKETLVKYLKTGKIIMHSSPKGQHYTFFCKIDDLEFDIKDINTKFADSISKPDLKEDQLEHDYIVMVSLDDIKEALAKGDDKIKNSFGKVEKIRNINISCYNFFFANFDK